MGKGVVSLAGRELAALVFAGNVVENGPEAGIVKEPGTPAEVFVALADGNDEFVSGKGGIVLVTLAVCIEELVKGYGVVSLALRLDPGDTGMLVELAVRTVEFADTTGLVAPVLTEPVVFVGDDVGIGMDSVLEVDAPVVLVWLFVGLGIGIGVFVNEYGMVSLALEELTEPVDSGIGDVNPSIEADTTVPLGRPLVSPPVRADEFVGGNGVVSVVLIEDSVVVGIRLVNDGTVENPVLSIELVGAVGPEATTVEVESG